MTLKTKDNVTTAERTVRYRVERTHRDGTVTVRAIFALDKDGNDRPGYLGDLYRNVRADLFTKI